MVPYGCQPKNRGKNTQNGRFIKENPIKMDDLVVPLFLETPISRFLGSIYPYYTFCDMDAVFQNYPTKNNSPGELYNSLFLSGLKNRSGFSKNKSRGHLGNCLNGLRIEKGGLWANFIATKLPPGEVTPYMVVF